MPRKTGEFPPRARAFVGFKNPASRACFTNCADICRLLAEICEDQSWAILLRSLRSAKNSCARLLVTGCEHGSLYRTATCNSFGQLLFLRVGACFGPGRLPISPGTSATCSEPYWLDGSATTDQARLQLLPTGRRRGRPSTTPDPCAPGTGSTPTGARFRVRRTHRSRRCRCAAHEGTTTSTTSRLPSTGGPDALPRVATLRTKRRRSPDVQPRQGPKPSLRQSEHRRKQYFTTPSTERNNITEWTLIHYIEAQVAYRVPITESEFTLLSAFEGILMIDTPRTVTDPYRSGFAHPRHGHDQRLLN